MADVENQEAPTVDIQGINLKMLISYTHQYSGIVTGMLMTS